MVTVALVSLALVVPFWVDSPDRARARRLARLRAYRNARRAA